ncbi:Carnosine N-methyltransferase [Candida viswanathii]|uniref:carnosine N-methyltransferase n=1 Tax=Candida viswanathii TaxID=5486 RepID=A0A367YLA0_9ASCO|nr:Carnosine N-methyltransferase [Candida viswanathii]
MNQDEGEQQALTASLLSFYNFFKSQFENIIKPRLIKYGAMTEEERKLLPWYQTHTDNLKLCIGVNRQFTEILAKEIAKEWGVGDDPLAWSPATSTEYDITSTTLLQLTREWSDEGQKERETSFSLILSELEEMYPDELTRHAVKILNPGCGLGRLVLELVMKGFWTQGNEISYHMLLTSSFILNCCQFPHSHTIFPFLAKSSHLVKRAYQTRGVTIPDVAPFAVLNELIQKNPQIPYGDLMSITAGSFLELYGAEVPDTDLSDAAANEVRKSSKDSFDVVVTNFFLDTASNIIDYIKAIHNVLKPGGKWINFGPLLWHFEGDYNVTYVKRGNHSSIPDIKKGLELSREDLIELIKNLGFVFAKHESGIENSYCRDIKLLGSFVFKCEYWVCEKV